MYYNDHRFHRLHRLQWLKPRFNLYNQNLCDLCNLWFAKIRVNSCHSWLKINDLVKAKSD